MNERKTVFLVAEVDVPDACDEESLREAVEYELGQLAGQAVAPPLEGARIDTVYIQSVDNDD